LLVEDYLTWTVSAAIHIVLSRMGTYTTEKASIETEQFYMECADVRVACMLYIYTRL